MEELLGNYYHTIIQHFSKYLQDLDFEENKETGELLHQLFYCNEEEIDSQRIIFHHGELLDLKSENNFLVNIICLLFELHLFYSEEIQTSIENLKQNELLDEKGKDYILFVEQVLRVEYSEDNEIVENFKKMLKVMPGDYEVVRLLWGGYYGERNDDILIEMVDLADQNDPFNNSVLHFKAFLLKEMDKFDDALEVYSSILKYDLNKKNSNHKISWDYLFIADCHLKLGNLQDAVDNVNESFVNLGKTEDNDLRILLLTTRGEALVHQQNTELAFKDFNKILQLDKENITALSFLKEYS